MRTFIKKHIWTAVKAVLWVDLFLALLVAGRRLGIGPEIAACIGTCCAYAAHRYRKTEVQYRKHFWWCEIHGDK